MSERETVHLHPAGISIFVDGIVRVATSGVAVHVGVEAAATVVPVVVTAAANARDQLLDGDHGYRDEIRSGVTVAQMQALAPFADRGDR